MTVGFVIDYQGFCFCQQQPVDDAMHGGVFLPIQNRYLIKCLFKMFWIEEDLQCRVLPNMLRFIPTCLQFGSINLPPQLRDYRLKSDQGIAGWVAIVCGFVSADSHKSSSMRWIRIPCTRPSSSTTAPVACWLASCRLGAISR